MYPASAATDQASDDQASDDRALDDQATGATGGPTAAPTDGFVSLTEAAEHLGVHYMTAYRYVRTGRMTAEKRAGNWWVSTADLQAAQAAGTGPRRTRSADRSDSWEASVVRVTARLTAGDTAGCWAIISATLSAGATPTDVHQRLLQPALIAIGERWRSGELTIADEHRATATTHRLLGQLGPLFRHPGRRRGTIVLGAVAGDRHALPSALLSDLLSDRHFEVIDLGADTPTESFAEVAEGIDDLAGIGLCAVVDECAPVLVDQATVLRSLFPRTMLVAGGTAVRMIDATEAARHRLMISNSADAACDLFDPDGARPASGPSSGSKRRLPTADTSESNDA